MAKVAPLTQPLTPEQKRLIEESLPKLRQWCEEIARRYDFRLEGCLEVGGLAMTECVRRFNPAEETPFHVFAYLRVRGEILDTLAKERKVARRHTALGPIAGEGEASSDPFREIETVRKDLADAAELLAASCALSLAEEEEAQILREAMGKVLTKQERTVVELRHFEEMPLLDVCAKLKMSPSTAKRRHRLALEKLDREVRARGVQRT